MSDQLSKKDLYESVKTLVELNQPHIHLNQHKLFTLFSIAFQYMLFRSTKVPGAFILRVDDSQLVDKLQRRAKDPSTRKFLQALTLPRKLKYNNSFFYLDFFNTATWNLTNDIPKEKIQGAIIVKNSSTRPMNEIPMEDESDPMETSLSNLPKDYYYNVLKDIVPKTICIAFDYEFDGAYKLNFPFIKNKATVIKGVKIASDVDLDKLDS